MHHRVRRAHRKKLFTGKHMNTATMIQLVSFTATVWPSIALADIHRCVLPSGVIEYQAVACPEGTSGSVISRRNTVAAKADTKSPETDGEVREHGDTKQEERTWWRRKVKTNELNAGIEEVKLGHSFRTDASCANASWAQSVRSYILQTTTHQEINGQVVYTIRPEWWPTIRLHVPQFVRAATDADTCTSGGARPVRFYSPDGEAVGM